MVKKIRLVIADPQPLIAQGLMHLFEADEHFHVAATAQRLTPAMLKAARPDVILLGYDHAGEDVCATIATAKAAVASARIFLLSCHAHPEALPRVFGAGASGYATRFMSPVELTAALRAVAEGQSFVDRRAGVCVSNDGRPKRRNHFNVLSERETQVVNLIAKGQSNRAISAALGLSEKTVKNHISRIFAKINVTTRTQAVVHAYETGIA